MTAWARLRFHRHPASSESRQRLHQSKSPSLKTSSESLTYKAIQESRHEFCGLGRPVTYRKAKLVYTKTFARTEKLKPSQCACQDALEPSKMKLIPIILSSDRRSFLAMSIMKKIANLINNFFSAPELFANDVKGISLSAESFLVSKIHEFMH